MLKFSELSHPIACEKIYRKRAQAHFLVFTCTYPADRLYNTSTTPQGKNNSSKSSMQAHTSIELIQQPTASTKEAIYRFQSPCYQCIRSTGGSAYNKYTAFKIRIRRNSQLIQYNTLGCILHRHLSPVFHHKAYKTSLHTLV